MSVLKSILNSLRSLFRRRKPSEDTSSPKNPPSAPPETPSPKGLPVPPLSRPRPSASRPPPAPFKSGTGKSPPAVPLGREVPPIDAPAKVPTEQTSGRQREAGKPKSQPPTPAQKPAPSTDAAPEIDLVLGIDFGTSCTKVVIGDHGWLGKSYAVPVGSGSEGLERFLRATQLRVGPRQEFNLKMRLMADHGSERLRNLAALYLAGVIRDSLQWFSDSGPRRYQGRTLAWSLNLGFPAKNVGDEPLAQAYKEVAALAARLGSSELPLTLASLNSLRSGHEDCHVSPLIPTNRIELYPEIAAQLAGYINSPYRTPGNLMLVDVGAGTLDVSTAILHGNNEEDVLSFHHCDVGPYGAFKLLEARIAALEEVAPNAVNIRLEDFQSGTRATPETVSEILQRNGRVAQAFSTAFGRASEEFEAKAVQIAVACASQFRKLQRDKHRDASFDPWPGHLRFFFTGGGSRQQFYRTRFLQGTFEAELVRFTRWKHDPEERRRHGQGLRFEPLHPPGDLQGFPEELKSDFDRLSVAHGLAYGNINLTRVTACSYS
jgi:hypothetical protein